jgi:hypothetical protein
LVEDTISYLDVNATKEAMSVRRLAGALYSRPVLVERTQTSVFGHIAGDTQVVDERSG